MSDFWEFMGGVLGIIGLTVVVAVGIVSAVSYSVAYFQTKNFNQLYGTHYTTSDMVWNGNVITKKFVGIQTVKNIHITTKQEK